MLPFKDRLATAAQLAYRSRMLFEVFCIYGREKPFEVIEDALDQYHWFFVLQGYANRFAAFVHLAGLVKPDPPKIASDKRTINLIDLVTESFATGGVDVTERDRLLALISSHQRVADGVKLIRDKAFSHRDIAVDLNSAFRTASITPNEVRMLSDATIEVANALCRVHGLMEVAVNVRDLQKDARRLFRKLGTEFPSEPKSAYDHLFGED